MKHRCPICRKVVKISLQRQGEEAKFFPFCSERCKLIDLGSWLDAEYKIASQLRQQSNKSPDISSGNPSDNS